VCPGSASIAWETLPVVPPHCGWSLLQEVHALGHAAAASERLFRLGKIVATSMENWGSERAARYLRFVCANESCDRLRGLCERVRAALA
jgi:hypothetical protein